MIVKPTVTRTARALHNPYQRPATPRSGRSLPRATMDDLTSIMERSFNVNERIDLHAADSRLKLMSSFSIGKKRKRSRSPADNDTAMTNYSLAGSTSSDRIERIPAAAAADDVVMVANGDMPPVSLSTVTESDSEFALLASGEWLQCTMECKKDLINMFAVFKPADYLWGWGMPSHMAANIRKSYSLEEETGFVKVCFGTVEEMEMAFEALEVDGEILKIQRFGIGGLRELM